MMLLRCIISSFVLTVALRVNEVATRGKNEEKLYSVEVSLAGTTTAGTDSAIEFSVNGVRRLTKTLPTQIGAPVVFHHLPRGSVITAYVHASQSACAYWVGAGGKQYEVGGWSLSFAPIDENDQGTKVDDLYEVYVEVAGRGDPVTVEVNHAQTQIVKNQVLRFPGQHKGALVKAAIASGHTCTYLVGNKESTCALDNSWGVRIGSVAEHGMNALDEGVVRHIDDAKNYTLHLTLDDAGVKHGNVIEIVLNKQVVARKKAGTEMGDGINLYHVATGSVLFAVSHTTGEACGIYVGSNIDTQTITCAGWTLDYTSEEEIPGTPLDDDDLFDVSVSVLSVSTEPGNDYTVTSDTRVTLLKRNVPVFFPKVSTGFSRGNQITPSVHGVKVQDCTHVVGEIETSCESDGWLFMIKSRLNNNDFHNLNHWIEEDDEDDEEEIEETPETYKFMVIATYTGSKSTPTLSCLARDFLEFIVKPQDATFDDVDNGGELFWSMELKESETNQKTVPKNVKFAMNSGEIKGKRLLNGGFYCTVTDAKNSLLCQADTDGKSMTMEKGCTLHIEIHQS